MFVDDEWLHQHSCAFLRLVAQRAWLNWHRTFRAGVAGVWPLVTSPCLPPCPHQPPLFCLPGNSSHESDVRPGETPFVKLQVLFICLAYESTSNLSLSAFSYIVLFSSKVNVYQSRAFVGSTAQTDMPLFVFLKSHRLCEQSRNVSQPVLVFPSSSVGWGNRGMLG